MNKNLIIRIVAGSTVGLYCTGFLFANKRIKKQRDEIFAKLNEVADDYTDLLNEYREATIVVELQNSTIELQQGLIEVLMSDDSDSKKSKKKKA